MLKYITYFFIIIIISAGNKDSSAQPMSWTQMQGPYGGSIIDITSGNGETIYTARYDGIFSTTNDGMSWQKMPEGNVANVAAIEIAPNGVLYVGKNSGGLWWSANNGISWNFNPIHVAPHSGTWASVITLGTNSTSHIFIQNEKSLNGGVTFNPHFQVSNQFARDYEFGAGNLMYAATNVGVYSSTNGGNSWDNIGITLPNANTVVKLGINASGDIFAGTGTNGIFYSSNGGSSWEARNTGLGDLNITAIESDNSGKIYAGTKNGLFASINNGQSWSPINNGIPHPWIQSIHIKADNRIFVGTQRRGVYFSNDGGQNWVERNTGIRLHNITALEFKQSNQIFLGSAYGLYYSPDGGVNWEDRSGAIPGGNVYSMGKGSDGSIYAGTSGFGVYKTTNDGISWNEKNNGLPPNSRVKDIIQLPDNNLVLLKEGVSTFDTLKLYKSTNGGDLWSEIYRLDEPLLSPAFGADGQGNIYMAGMTIFIEGLLIRSTNGGASFEELNTGSTIKFDYFTTTGNNLFSITYDKIYKSTNQGSNWEQLPLGPWGNNRVGPLRVSNDGDLFLNGGSNIYISENGGQSWSTSNSGLSSPLGFRDFVFDENAFAYIFTYEEGVFKSDSPTNIMVNPGIPNKFSLAQNYPNPFNPVTQIKFDLPQSSIVKLTIYDISGKEAARLVNGTLQAGSYSYSFNAEGFPSGIYFYRLDADDYGETKKMMLVK